MKYTDKEKEALSYIGRFYLISANGDYTLACERIAGLQIHRITYVGSELVLYLGRPGLLIGHHGDNIEKLGEFLRKELSNSTLHIKICEDCLNDYLYPKDYASTDYDFDDYDCDYGEEGIDE